MKAASSNGFVRSNVSRKAQRTSTTFMNTELFATCCPGHTRRPKPNTKNLRSSLTRPSVSSQRSGLNASGSGKTSGSREMALKLLFDQLYSEGGLLPVIAMYRCSGWNTIIFKNNHLCRAVWYTHRYQRPPSQGLRNEGKKARK